VNVSPNTIVFPVDSKSYGKSYAEWSAIWWQWLLSIPNDTSPADDSTGKSCATNQQGPIWFLAGTFGGAATVIQIDITNTIKIIRPPRYSQLVMFSNT
jgi:hypothetical protein